MAVIKVPQSSRLILKVQTGVNDDGKAVYRQRSFNNLKADATDDDIHAVGLVLAGLQQYQVEAIGRIDDVQLVGQ